jgi:hypothetical protein
VVVEDPAVMARKCGELRNQLTPERHETLGEAMSSASVLNGNIVAMLAIALVFEDEEVGLPERDADGSPVIRASEQSGDDERKN